MSEKGITEYIPADEYKEEAEAQSYQEYTTTDWESTMTRVAKPHTKLVIPRDKDMSRKKVVAAFTDAFELMGGVPRLALWADKHPTDFYKLYARRLPSQASSALGETNEVTIKHILPRGSLDV